MVDSEIWMVEEVICNRDIELVSNQYDDKHFQWTLLN